ncbi:MAG: AAA family ATPase [Clostridium sp.]|uniref:AAA family ATPase n=1 Tax=Clostridium sp. TaxID=1506 RepID=UPI003029DCA2
MNNVVRIQEVEVKDFKNVVNGNFAFESYRKKRFFDKSYTSDILGLYGQNGSGKTSMVEAIDILKVILSGGKLSSDTKKLLSYNKGESEFKYTFTIEIKEKKYLVYYRFKLRYIDEFKRIDICEESLRCADIDREKKVVGKVKGIIEINMDESFENIFRPIKNYKMITKKNEAYKTSLIVSKELAKESSNSFIFNNRSMTIFKEAFEDDTKVYYEIISSLKEYAIAAFVIKNDHLGSGGLNSMIPFSFMVKSEVGLARGTVSLSLFDTNTVGISMYNLLDSIVQQINIVLTSLIPGLTIEMKLIKEELIENGEIGKVFELISVRDGISIPLKYESDGIKKIISVLSALIAMYNDEKICVVIDEFDSGIFEFLLGELLGVLKEKAKGQLIFTSHNLRALEVLDKTDIVFTTTNTNNRYIKMKNVKNSNNLRDFYLREIFLGGQSEPIYNKTKSYAISRAFRKAGKLYE